MGTGKTQFTKSLITQLYLEQCNNIHSKELGILIFDYKGDYNDSKKDFVDATKAQIFQPYHLPFNPLALPQGQLSKKLLPMHTANAFKETISKAFHLGPKQQDLLLQCIMNAYHNNGITKDKPETWNNISPTFEQVYQCYKQNNNNDSLSAALNKLHNFECLEPEPNKTQSLFELLKGVVVIDLSGFDSDIQSFIIAITLDLFYSQMQSIGSSKIENNNRQITKMILVDEADHFMSEGFPALKKILKEGREFGVGTILSTQSLEHFGNNEDDYSKYIWTWVVHNVSDLKNSDVEFILKTDSKSSQTYYNAIKSLEKHHSIIKIGNEHPIYVKDKAFFELYNEQFNDDKDYN